MSNAHR